MLNDEDNTGNPIPVPGSHHQGSSSRVQISVNTRARLEKLVGWRIDPVCLKFPNRGSNFEGGCAIVSRALLEPSSNETRGHLIAPSGGEVDPSDRIARSECGNGGQEGEGTNETARNEEKEAAEGQVDDFDDEASGRRKIVAVKMMKMKTPDDIVRVLESTLREAEFLVRLSHENIIKLEGFVEDVSKEIFWLVFSWEDNGNLKDFVALHDWAVSERLSLIYDVISGVQYIHSRDPPICHADLKSINILINSQCRAVITNFGTAHHPATNDLSKKKERAMEEPRTAPPVEATYCTSTNTLTLTGIHCAILWAAPEVLEGDESSIASDIWALGWVAYEVMTNSVPFHSLKEPMTIHRVVPGYLPFASHDIRMLLMQELCSIMSKCWNLDPSKRPTAKECQDSISWMPKTTPNPIHAKDVAGTVNRSAALLMKQGCLHTKQSDFSSASKHFTKALAINTKVSGDRKGTADALFQLAHTHTLQLEYSQAVSLYTEALGIYSEISNSHGKANVLWGLADIHRLHDEYSEAFTLYSEALQIFIDIGDKRGGARALLGLADVYRLQTEYSQALPLYSECLQIQSDLGDGHGRAEVLCGLADLHRRREEYSLAVAYYSECIQIRTDIGARQGRAQALWSLAQVHRLQKDYSQAMTLLSEALTVAIEIDDKYLRALILHRMADVHRDQHDDGNAIHYYEQAAEIYKEIGHRHEAKVLKRAADLRQLMDQSPR